MKHIVKHINNGMETSYLNHTKATAIKWARQLKKQGGKVLIIAEDGKYLTRTGIYITAEYTW